MSNVKVTGIAHGGEAIGRYEGKTIFVPYAIPGEVVRVEIVQDRRRYARARLIEVLEPSPWRVEPRCPHAPRTGTPGECGGCHWQHIAYEAQLRFKTDIVREQLQRLGGLSNPPVAPAIPAPTAWEYRNHVEFSATPEGQPGLFDADGARVIPISECHIIEPALAEVFAALDLELPELVRLSLRKGSADDDLMLIFETQDDEPPELETDLPLSVCLLTTRGDLIPLIGNPYITFHVSRFTSYVSRFTSYASHFTFHISPATFFQVNTAQVETLVRLVDEFLALRGGETVLDAYCGAGLFTAAIAAQAGRVIGIEASPSACYDFERNLAHLDNVQLYPGQVEAILPGLSDKLDAAVLDPPRGGCEPGALEALIAHHPRRLVYVSCDPATLARDLKRLNSAGYRVERVQPLDMFPQTFHIETCVQLTSP